ncbi:DUF6542 domain-containing protein, partial [Amycolatopsis rhizosphaerae]|uniref:DUF6542 domain-containing protein n=1 Tax=Amycolatopsis rhizosphaerae TaxID=2053003 RepID=UPI0016436DCA
MTATRDRQSDPDAAEVAVPWDVRPLVGERRGLPWFAAVLLTFGLAVVGAIVDTKMSNTLGWTFRVCYFLGAVGAVVAVQRRSLFGPMVQPPLILAVTVLGTVLLVSGMPENSDTLAKVLALGTPLINGFPLMAVTTGCTLALGLFRIYRERDPNTAAKKAADDRRRPPGKARPPRDGEDAPGRERQPGRRAAPGREGQPGREGAAGREGAPPRTRRPGEGRAPVPRNPGAEQHPSLPMTRRPRPDEPPRRREPGGRGGVPGAPGTSGAPGASG